VSPAYVKQVTGLEFVPLDDGTAFWFKSPHKLVLVDQQGVERTEEARTVGPTLVWEEYGRDVTVRLEGIADKDRAVTVAESVPDR
jgi:hypothetical protein